MPGHYHEEKFVFSRSGGGESAKSQEPRAKRRHPLVPLCGSSGHLVPHAGLLGSWL